MISNHKNSLSICLLLTGVLSQTVINGTTPSTNKAYLLASYVTWIESAGARVVPVLINQTESYYDKLYKSLNG